MDFTIQPEVDKMKEQIDIKSVTSKVKKISNNRRMSIAPAKRPSTVRNTESISGTCKVCDATSWDTDNNRGETICSECGYVAEQNMIDPGAEWINHSGADDRSRVGAPSTLTLSDRGEGRS
ncbi:MAG: TFIIB-type zinc ribbon-containing protein [Candidatus Poseidoniales archaeon]